VVGRRLLCAFTAFILSGEMKRPTPCFDDWLVGVERALAIRGKKAELARYLAKRYGRPPRSWEASIAQILGRVLLPNAETVLAINGWLSRTKSRKASSDTRAGRNKS
jgi:hypothetical protein